MSLASDRRRLMIAVGLLGAVALCAQVLLLRELLVAFQGNELSVGLVLGVWLAAGAAGSLAGSRLAGGPVGSATGLVWAIAVAGLLLPVALFVIRDLKPLFDLGPAETLTLWQLAVGAVIALLPVGAASGFAFAGALGAARSEQLSASTVYVAESIGMLAGGLAFTCLLAPTIAPFSIALLVTALAGGAAVLAAPRVRTSGFAVGASLVVGALVAVAARLPERLEQAALERQWPGWNVVASGYSRYGQVILIERDRQTSVYENGQLSFAAPEPVGSEEFAHLALLQVERPRLVLLVGGGMTGVLREIVKYPVERIDYVELDPLVVRLAAQHLPDALPDDRRVRIITADARAYLARSRHQYDVVMIQAPPPHSALVNRYYTLEFFRLARDHLSRHGVLVTGLPGGENYVSPEVLGRNRSIAATVREVFSQVAVTPMEYCHLLAAGDGAALTIEPAALGRRLERSRIRTQYVSRWYFEDILPAERRQFIIGLYAPGRDPINRDLHPVGYLLDLGAWNLMTGFLPPALWQRVRRIGPTTAGAIVLVVAALIAVICAAFLRGPRRRPGARTLFGVAAAGLAGMAVEVVVLLAFQARSGYLYRAVGLLIATFMLGLAVGAWAAGRRQRGRWAWRAVLIGFAIAASALPLLLNALGGSPWMSGAALVVFGAAVGAIYPLAVQRTSTTNSSGGGVVYGADLAGAAVGALMVAALLIPLLGATATCGIAGALLLAAAAVSW